MHDVNPYSVFSVHLWGHYITEGIQPKYVLENYIEIDKYVNRKSVSKIF